MDIHDSLLVTALVMFDETSVCIYPVLALHTAVAECTDVDAVNNYNKKQKMLVTMCHHRQRNCHILSVSTRQPVGYVLQKEKHTDT